MKASLEIEDSIDEYADDFDDDHVVETIRSPPRPAGRPRPPSAMKRQMSQKEISEPVSVPSVISQEGSSVFEDYGDDFEKNNGSSSIFSDHRTVTAKPPTNQPATGGGSVENEYAEDFNDFNSSVASISQALPQKESSVTEYADDFETNGSHTEQPTPISPARSVDKPPPQPDSIVEYSDDFDGPALDRGGDIAGMGGIWLEGALYPKDILEDRKSKEPPKPCFLEVCCMTGLGVQKKREMSATM